MRGLPVVVALALLGCGGAAARVQAAPAPSSPAPAPGVPDVNFDEFHGFNLLGKFSVDWSNHGFAEEDFRIIHELGYDFARLPVDYRTYVRPGNWLDFDEASLEQIDRALEYGRKWGVHVCLNLHRGPGYTVATPPEPRSLWKDSDAQAAFRAHWEMFARRFRTVPAAALSFNLVNEPSGVSDETYGAVMRPVVAAIRAISPDRPIVADGIDGGSTPVKSLVGLGIVQATRGYQPFSLTHYKASWVQGSDSWPEPAWPPVPSLSAFLYGPAKAEFRSTLGIKLPAGVSAGARIGIDVHQVSGYAMLVVRDAQGEVWRHEFKPGAGQGEWTKVVHSEQWNVYQNLYDKEFDVSLPRATNSIAIEVVDGDWLTLNSVSLPDGARTLTIKPADHSWGSRQTEYTLEASGKLVPVAGAAPSGPEILRRHLEPWLALRARGERIFVGEFGAFNKTPEDVTLAWTADLMTVYRDEHLGWAMWNLTGGFGILDSERPGAEYEDYRGHKLDRKMLALLKNEPISHISAPR